MIVEPGQVFFVQHNGRVDPFLVLGQRELYHDGRVFKWTVLNLSTGESLYVYDDEW